MNKFFEILKDATLLEEGNYLIRQSHVNIHTMRTLSCKKITPELKNDLKKSYYGYRHAIVPGNFFDNEGNISDEGIAFLKSQFALKKREILKSGKKDIDECKNIINFCNITRSLDFTAFNTYCIIKDIEFIPKNKECIDIMHNFKNL